MGWEKGVGDTEKETAMQGCFGCEVNAIDDWDSNI